MLERKFQFVDLQEARMAVMNAENKFEQDFFIGTVYGMHFRVYKK